jgi:hypothetical protein
MNHPTPGRWIVNKEKVVPAVVSERNRAWPIVSVVHGATVSESLANAKLIAAAPEMYALCKMVYDYRVVLLAQQGIPGAAFMNKLVQASEMIMMNVDGRL